MPTKNTPSQRKSIGLGAALLAVLLILVLTLAPAPADTQAAANVQPELLAMAAEQPDELVAVIVQKADSSAQAEARTVELGGAVTRDLHIINSFAAEMPAAAAVDLSYDANVAWISLDGPMRGASATTETMRDEFNAPFYDNNDGSAGWAGNWSEINDDNRADRGRVRINHGELLLADNDRGIQRAADLSGAATAVLSFDYRRQSFDNFSDYVRLDVSADSGATWTELGRFSGKANEWSMTAVSYGLTPYVSGNTVIRFMSSAKLGRRDSFYVDNVQIEYTINSAAPNEVNYYLDTVNIRPVWAMGYEGQGVTVAVVDSGIDNKHADFDVAMMNAHSRILADVQFGGSGTDQDKYGHGTHVAGIIGGNGTRSDGLYVGVAPGVNLLDVRVSDNHGASTTTDVIAGLQWVLENKNVYNVQVVNLSLNGAAAESYHTSPLDAAVEILWFNEIVVVVSAGNNGNDGYIYPPANDPFVITVGAADEMDTAVPDDDQLAAYSARGLTESGYAKPDLVAPGHDIIAALSSKSDWPAEHPSHIVSAPYSSDYFRLSGSSMAAAITSGAAALLLQSEPYLNPDQVKYRLMATAQPFTAPTSGSEPGAAGAGYLDVYAVITTPTIESANTGTEASQLLWTGGDPITWGSVNWGSVNWGSVNWGSVNWGSVNWGSVNWGSVSWDE